MDSFDELPLHVPDFQHNIFSHLYEAPSDHHLQGFITPLNPIFAPFVAPSPANLLPSDHLHLPRSLPDSAASDNYLTCKRNCPSPPEIPQYGAPEISAVPARPFAATEGKSRSESLRRKRMSKLFSKLEVLLPHDDIPKFDRCSVIDASIRYIRSLEGSIAEASHGNIATASMTHQKLENSNVSTIDGKPSCPISGNSSTTVQICEGAQQSVVAVTADLDHAFVNAVSCNRDPVMFSRVLSMLEGHSLEILSATFSRCQESVVYAVHAKIPETIKLCNQLLRDKIYNLIVSTPEGSN